MRLIDADKLRQSVTNEMIKAELNSPLYCTLECVISDIDGQPNAYDVDKVVEKIREYADKVAELGGNFLPQVVIEIVKSGGID